jgi:hypothetical protein
MLADLPFDTADRLRLQKILGEIARQQQQPAGAAIATAARD